jgi:hypothetical protein
MDDSYHAAPVENASEESNAPKKDTEQAEPPETQETETTAPYSMEQKYAKLTTDNRVEIEEACAQYLYRDWLTASNEIFSVSEYEIDGRGRIYCQRFAQRLLYRKRPIPGLRQRNNRQYQHEHPITGTICRQNTFQMQMLATE